MYICTIVVVVGMIIYTLIDNNLTVTKHSTEANKSTVFLRLQAVTKLYVPGSINSHYFHIIGDGKNQPNSVGVYRAPL